MHEGFWTQADVFGCLICTSDCRKHIKHRLYANISNSAHLVYANISNSADVQFRQNWRYIKANSIFLRVAGVYFRSVCSQLRWDLVHQVLLPDSYPITSIFSWHKIRSSHFWPFNSSPFHSKLSASTTKLIIKKKTKSAEREDHSEKVQAGRLTRIVRIFVTLIADVHDAATDRIYDHIMYLTKFR